jgi:hypothetical protein
MTEKKGRAELRVGVQMPFRGWEAKTRREHERRYWCGAAGRHTVALTDEQRGPREERGTPRGRRSREAALRAGVRVVEVDR